MQKPKLLLSKSLRFIFSFFILYFSFFICSAQTKNDPEAKKLLDAVSKNFKSFKTVQANYILKVQDRNGKEQGKKTGLIYMKDAKYKIVDKNLQIFCNGKNTWRYDSEANEVTVSSIDDANQTLTPQKLFTDFYDKDFLYKLNGVKNNIAEIELTPIDKRKAFHKVYLYVNKGNNTINSAKVLETAGNTYSYSMSNMKTNINLKDDMFVFDKTKYPGVEEITQ